MVGALEETGALEEVAHGIASVTGGNRVAELLGILAFALGACLGGNATIVAAACNGPSSRAPDRLSLLPGLRDPGHGGLARPGHRLRDASTSATPASSANENSCRHCSRDTGPAEGRGVPAPLARRDARTPRRLPQRDRPALRETEHVDVSTDFSDTQVAEIFLHHRVLIVPVTDGGRSARPTAALTLAALGRRQGRAGRPACARVGPGVGWARYGACGRSRRGGGCTSMPRTAWSSGSMASAAAVSSSRAMVGIAERPAATAPEPGRRRRGEDTARARPPRGGDGRRSGRQASCDRATVRRRPSMPQGGGYGRGSPSHGSTRPCRMA